MLKYYILINTKIFNRTNSLEIKYLINIKEIFILSIHIF